ncbi:hypothetical protein [Jonesia quinghaiensis]|uniref:hypothetical protein n=1 Tax=Jonesia quinghaiensis TaxID=262806 RepID=UPI0004252215|nr:hypothetical protein [Jonesia quinghaiensis]
MLRRVASFCLSIFGSLPATAAYALVGYTLQMAAIATHQWQFAVPGLALWAAGEFSLRMHPKVAALLRRAAFGFAVRLSVSLLLVSLIVGTNKVNEQLTTTVVFAILTLLLHCAQVLLMSSLNARRSVSVDARNIDAYLPTHTYRPRFLAQLPEVWRTVPAALLFGIPAMITDTIGAVVIFGLIAALWQLVVLGQIARCILDVRRVPRTGDRLALIQSALNELNPQVALYFSGDAPSTYQVNSWLSTMERLERQGIRGVVVLREKSVFNALAPTSIPVLCIPGAVDLMSLDFGSVRVALYPANVGKNIHFLRIPTMRSVFVGHGDSDKNASFNPYSKVYDEVWTAGQAGIDRYVRAEIGVHTEDVVAVGRPQVLDLLESSVAPTPIPTILYAPTWEGWNELQNYCSIPTVGRQLVEAVRSSATPVRLIYRPHPFTGRRSAEVMAAHNEIVDALAQLNAQVVTAPIVLPEFVADNAVSSLELLDQQSRRDAAYIAAFGERGHITSDSSAGLSIWSCMAAADFMVADISSVISDFIALDRPYAVTNCTGKSTSEFLEEFPSASGAQVLSPANPDLAQVLGVATGNQDDAFREARGALRRALLGDAPETSVETFSAAVRRLSRESQQRNERVAALGMV